MSPVPDPSQDHKGSPINDFSDHQGPTFMGPPGSSSEEENDLPDYGAYQQLSQGPDSTEEDSEIDYNSLSGIMSALNTHGPTEIETNGFHTPQNENSSAQETNGNEAMAIAQTSVPESIEDIQSRIPSHAQMLLEEAEKQRNNDYMKEQASLWSFNPPANRIEIDEHKEQEIKSVMSKITLPKSAIPAWASEISDEEWKCQISSRIFGNIKNDSEDSE